MNDEDQQSQEREEKYHAYPNTPAPWTMGFLTGVFSRYGRGMLLWALAGAGVAVVLWLAYTIYYYNTW